MTILKRSQVVERLLVDTPMDYNRVCESEMAENHAVSSEQLQILYRVAAGSFVYMMIGTLLDLSIF